jgi:hypothetical protein
MGHDPHPETPPATNPDSQNPATPPVGTEPASFETDEPPVIINGGSLFLEFPTGKNIVQFAHMPDDHRPFKYRYAAGHPERDLESIRVVKQLDTGAVGFPLNPASPRIFPEAQKCILKIWLQPLTLSGGNVVPGTLETEPDIQIRGATTDAGTPPSLHIETRRQFLAEVHSFKKSRIHRNDYPPIAPHFRIGRWQVVTGVDPVQVLDEESGADAYQLFVTFHTH